MRKLKLEMQISADGFSSSQDGNNDWMVWNWAPDWGWDTELRRYHEALTFSSDCILLSRMMAEEGFHQHWQTVAENSASPQSSFARAIGDMRKIVFSRTLKESRWANTEIARSGLAEEVSRRKQEPGKDIIVYGGPILVSSLVEAGLIDEFHFIVNPALLGRGKPVLGELHRTTRLRLVDARPFPCGVAVLHYART
ncbi:deaminase [Labrys sp. WJW]|uniref:dihydrofolate reductase family protein n=1 Tax=Labrys sp. WJW TaxID=1737983 RepID=UPI000829C714|nr:dihydrofolate reductase family protein [Labrys sp. WJW]OCC04142.1 deaminase [Labrys sp. WJW]